MEAKENSPSLSSGASGTNGGWRVLKDQPRTWQVLKEKEAIFNLIEVKLHRRSLYLKGTLPPAEFTPGARTDDGLEFYCNPSLELGENVVLYITLNRQLEIDFKRTRTIEPGCVVLVPVQARIGASQRAHPRLAPVDPEIVVATNFRISTNRIAPNNTKLQITTQVIFPDFEKLHAAALPGLRILLAGDSKLPPEIAEQLPDRGMEMSVQGVAHYVQPILVLDDDSWATLATLFFPVPAGGMTDALRVQAEEIAEEVLQKVIDANTSLIKEKQKISNISEGGVALEIDNEILKKNLPLRESFTFDLLFKMHAPIRFFGSIRHIVKKGNSLVVGVDFSGQGHSEYRKGTKEVYHSLLQKMQQQTESH